MEELSVGYFDALRVFLVDQLFTHKRCRGAAWPPRRRDDSHT